MGSDRGDDWGDTDKELFDFVVDGQELSGTAGFLEAGKAKAEQSGTARSQAIRSAS